MSNISTLFEKYHPHSCTHSYSSYSIAVLTPQAERMYADRICPTRSFCRVDPQSRSRGDCGTVLRIAWCNDYGQKTRAYRRTAPKICGPAESDQYHAYATGLDGVWTILQSTPTISFGILCLTVLARYSPPTRSLTRRFQSPLQPSASCIRSWLSVNTMPWCIGTGR